MESYNNQLNPQGSFQTISPQRLVELRSKVCGSWGKFAIGSGLTQ
jgi:hypothetical protein